MGRLDRDFVISALQNARFDELVGEFENEWLECKGQPYDLTREDQKLELAKDITGLANAGGGLLLLSSRPIFAVKAKLITQQGLGDEALGVVRRRAAHAA